MTLPKQIAYSEPRLQPPPGYKDTTVPGIFSRDTLFSHGNHEPGWVVAPGMQGIDVQPFTANMLTPESLSELMGGPDIVAPPAPPAFGVSDGRLPGPPNAYARTTRCHRRGTRSRDHRRTCARRHCGRPAQRDGTCRTAARRACARSTGWSTAAGRDGG